MNKLTNEEGVHVVYAQVSINRSADDVGHKEIRRRDAALPRLTVAP
jgi:hypothetical protein